MVCSGRVYSHKACPSLPEVAWCFFFASFFSRDWAEDEKDSDLSSASRDYSEVLSHIKSRREREPSHWNISFRDVFSLVGVVIVASHGMRE